MAGTSGTVTFLFTDIEDSTRLWQLDETAMRAAVARHDEIVQSVIGEFSGTVFSTMGDGVAAVFASAGAAVTAAGEAQSRLKDEPWPTAQEIRVRMGLHSGEAEVRSGDYFGTAVNRAARIMALGHGGQVLCSKVTAGLASERLAHGMGLVDLGSHRLRDLSGPEQIHQLVAPGLARDFPRLRSLDVLPGNLPVQPTAFIGRQREVKELADMILSARIITLTGVGGVGKTRLALQAAAEVLQSFRDGVWLVELAGVGSQDSVQDAMVSALSATGGIAPGTGSIEEQLRSKELLLVLDNCEHLLTPVAAHVERIAQHAPDVRVLATSREGLGVAGEHLWTVGSLELPPSTEGAAAILATDSALLFLERAREASSSFSFSDEHATAVAEICRRLDGIPLAIELAAARVPALTPAEIVGHLDRRFKLLTGGRRAALPRHQTLRNAIEWSYQLLDPDEQAVLERLSVFSGGFDLGGAQAVASADDLDALDVLDLVGQLVAKSLVVAEPRDASTRYRLLETVRDFAWEQLGSRGEVDTVARRHAAHFAAFARAAGAGLRGPEEAMWRGRLIAEIDNLRAVLSWAIAEGEIGLVLEPIASLSVFGDRSPPYGLLAEEAARLAEDHPLAPVALAAACFAASQQGDGDRAWQLAEEARRRTDALAPSPDRLWVRCRVANGCCFAEGSRGEWVAYGQRWLADARELGDEWSLCEALTFTVGTVELEEAVAAGEEALQLARQLRCPSRISLAAVILGGRLADSDPERAEELIAEANDAAVTSGNDWTEFMGGTAAILMQVSRGQHRAAADVAIDAMELWQARGVSGSVTQFALQLATLLYTMGDKEGSLVLVAWGEGRGMRLQPLNGLWNALGTAELAAFRDRQSAAELSRVARRATSLDEAALVAFAHDRLAFVDDGAFHSQ